MRPGGRLGMLNWRAEQTWDGRPAQIQMPHSPCHAFFSKFWSPTPHDFTTVFCVCQKHQWREVSGAVVLIWKRNCWDVWGCLPPSSSPSLTFFCEPDLSVAPPSTCPILAYTVLHPCLLLAPTTTPSYGLALCVAPSSNCLMMSYSYTELLVATHVHFL